MNKNVSITVSSTQSDSQGQELLTEVTCAGQYFEKNDCRYVLYEEIDPDSAAVTKNTLKWTDKRLELIRHGNITAHMVFASGQSNRTGYTTPYGTLTFTVTTEEMHIVRSETAVAIRLCYQLSAETSLLSRNRLIIKIRNL